VKVASLRLADHSSQKSYRLSLGLKFQKQLILTGQRLGSLNRQNRGRRNKAEIIVQSIPDLSIIFQFIKINYNCSKLLIILYILTSTSTFLLLISMCEHLFSSYCIFICKFSLISLTIKQAIKIISNNFNLCNVENV
jgi:hypothetical protein